MNDQAVDNEIDPHDGHHAESEDIVDRDTSPNIHTLSAPSAVLLAESNSSKTMMASRENIPIISPTSSAIRLLSANSSLASTNQIPTTGHLILSSM